MAVGAIIAGVGGAAVSASGSRSAARAQENAANTAADVAERADQRAREDLQPFREAGGDALDPLLQLVLNGPESDFERTEGFDAIENSAAAGGKLRSGGTLRALTEFNSGLNGRNRNSRFNELFNVATLGANAGARQATGTLNTAARVGDLITQAGNARASGRIGTANAINSGINNLSFLSLLNG